MSIGLALLLGITQGITELFPLSSLGILVVLPHALHIPFSVNGSRYLPFVVALHAGTALALLLYFLGDWVRLIGAGIRWLGGDRTDEPRAKMLGRLIIATIPAGIAGYAFKSPLAALFSIPLLAACVLIVNGGVLFLGDAWNRRAGDRRTPDAFTPNEALSVGLFQMFALIPGLSRSGLAMTGTLRLGVSHEESARFAFLLATPIIAAAALLELPHLGHQGMSGLVVPSIVGGIAAGIVAWLSTHFLLRYFERRRLRLFGIISVLIGVVSLILVH